MYDPGHVLSRKSARQHRNVFIWCTDSCRVALGWRVDSDSPITVSTAYRWVTNAVQTQHPRWEEAESYALFPVVVRPSGVLSYSVHKNGTALSRESQEIIDPGDYGLYTLGDGSDLGLYYFFPPVVSFSAIEKAMKVDSVALSVKTFLSPSIAQEALDRDQQCIFSRVIPSSDSDTMVATWVFPPFLGFELSEDPYLENKYYDDPDACGLCEFMVVENVVSGHKDIVTLFWENKLGIDVDDNYGVIMFEGPELLKGVALKSHLTLVDGPHRPSDRFLGIQVHADLVREQISEYSDEQNSW